MSRQKRIVLSREKRAISTVCRHYSPLFETIFLTILSMSLGDVMTYISVISVEIDRRQSRYLFK